MNALLIDPARRSVEFVEFDGSLDAVRALIGFPSIDADEIRGGTDRLFFDEECFLRLDHEAGRFQLDALAPVSGRGVVTGPVNGERAAAPSIDLESLRARVAFG